MTKRGCQLCILFESLTLILIIVGWRYSTFLSAKLKITEATFLMIVIFGLPFAVPLAMLLLTPFMPKLEDKYPGHAFNCGCGYHRKQRVQ